MNEIGRLPRVLTWVGIGFALLVPVLVAGVLAAQPGGPGRLDLEWPRFAALGLLTLLPPALAWAGLHHRRRALMGTAAILGLLLGVVAVPFGLVLWISVIAWAQAASRIPGSAPADRRAPGGVVVVAPTVLALAAVVALFVFQNPTCWTYEDHPDGTRVYSEARPDPTQPSGFGRPSLTQTGSESSDAVEIDPDTGEPLHPEPEVITGRECTSDRVTPAQGGASILLTLSAGAVAVRLGRPRTPTSSR